MSRLWTPFEKWALENKAPKLIEWGMACFNTLWDQINLEQLYGQEFDKYYRYLDKIDGKIERLVDEEIEVEGSIAYPLLEVFSSALCCFYDPKLLPGLQRSSFWSDITVIVGQGAEYIYDTIFSDAGEIYTRSVSPSIHPQKPFPSEIPQSVSCVLIIAYNIGHFNDFITPAIRSRLCRPPALSGRFWRRAGCTPSPPVPRPVRGLWRRSGRSIRPVCGGCGRWRWSAPQKS